MGDKRRPCKNFRAAAAALASLCVAPLLVGCTAGTYADIPLAAGAGGLELQDLATRARANDKQAQLELGKRFEEGRGVPRDLRRARALYGAAAKDVGGTRMMFVPDRSKSVLAVPVNSGVRVIGLIEAKTALQRLAAAQALQPTSPPIAASASPVLHSDSGGAGKDRELIYGGSVGSVFSTIVKLEMFSEKCLVRGREYSEDRGIYAGKAWNCLLASQLPDDCATYPDAILRSVRFVRFHPNFIALQKLMPRVIKKCLAAYKGSVGTAYNEVKYAGILDLALDGLKQSTARQRMLVDRFRESDSLHSYTPNLPGYAFSDEMCGKLAAGAEIEQSNFWFLFCDNINDGHSPRADRSEAIDKVMRERNLDVGAN